MVACVALCSAPMGIWAILAAVARIWHANLRSTLPALRAARWAMWLLAIPLMIPFVAFHKFIWLWPFGSSAFAFAAGLAIPERWVKKRYAPDLLPTEPSPFGWFPSAHK